MNFPFSSLVKSENDTLSVAKRFSSVLENGDLITLNGDLGSGKTFFVKSCCADLNINNVNSPSFAIVYEYSGSKKVYHFDFYRIKKIEELYDIGIDEYFNDEDAIKFIEWSNLMSEIIPNDHYSVKINIVKEDIREIIIEKNG